ncbi:MAG: glycosyltransferase family 4 protein [Gammaproteobacteria bacterium]|nr:glycosyltransferase family 4 protein [Gammaproteobacteria bacterium]
MFGSEIALKCAKYHDKPFFSRFGYMLSEFEQNENREYQKFIDLENQVFEDADKIIVTTKSIKSKVEKRIKKRLNKIVIVPNYVDTNLFKPQNNPVKKYDILFVGRIVQQKNLISLLKALDTINLNALIIGNGYIRDELISQFSHLKERITWKKNIPNNELPALMNQSKLFILPSHYEGHPKILLEAMSCGMTVIGANSPGIVELIKHDINGYLSTTDFESIRLAINKLLSKSDLQQSLGDCAREYVLNNFSLEKVVKLEYDLYSSIV